MVIIRRPSEAKFSKNECMRFQKCMYYTHENNSKYANRFSLALSVLDLCYSVFGRSLTSVRSLQTVATYTTGVARVLN